MANAFGPPVSARRFFGTQLHAGARNANPKLLHSRLQRRPLHPQPGRGAVWSGNDPVGFAQSSDDFLPFRLVESRLQIPVAVTEGAFTVCAGTKMQLVRRHLENRPG